MVTLSNTHRLLLLLAPVFIISCSQDYHTEANNIEITAEFEPYTKVTLAENSTAIQWEPEDAINVFYKGGAEKFISQNLEPSPYATFSGTLFYDFDRTHDGSISDMIWALSPYDPSSKSYDELIYATLPSSQTARRGSFDKSAFISAGRSSFFNIRFYNVCGGVRFSVQCEGITRAVFRGNRSEYISGDFSLGMDDDNVPFIKEVITPTDSIILNCKEGFKKGEWYYICMLPCSLSKGYSLTLYSDSKCATKESSTAVDISRSTFGSIENADSGLTWVDYSPDVPGIPSEEYLLPTPPANQLYYQTIHGVIVDFTDITWPPVQSNDYKNGMGVIECSDNITDLHFKNLDNNNNIVSLSIPESQIYVSNFPPSLPELTSFIFPGEIQGNDHRFYDYPKLKYAVLPKVNGWIYVHNCPNLKELSLQSLGLDISSCGNLEEIVCREGGDILDLRISDSPVKELVLPSSLKILKGNIRSERLTQVLFPSGLQVIDSYVFHGSGLKIVQIPSQIQTIGNGAFAESAVTYASLPVYSDAVEAFKDCLDLRGVSLTPSLNNRLADGIFSGCRRLEKITIPNNLTIIGDSAFYGCESLTTFNFDNIIELEHRAFAGAGLLEFHASPSIILGEFSFSGCKSLSLADLSESKLTAIPDGLFSKSGLTKIYLPATLYEIGDSAFSGSEISNIELPETLLQIGKDAFSECSELKIVNFPASLEAINRMAYYQSGLTKATISGTNLSIGTSAFAGSHNLTTVLLNEGVSIIGDYAFATCNLREITFPSSITAIGENAFYKNSLSCIYCKALIPPSISSDSFPGTLQVIYVPRSVLSEYLLDENWSRYSGIIKAYDFN